MSGKTRTRVYRREFLLGAAVTFTLSFSACGAQTNVLTWHNDNARTGQNLSEGILSPANVSSSTFGRLYNLSVDGKVDAQPLYVSALNIAGHRHNVVFAETEHDSVYAFDADSGKIYWQLSLLGSGETTSDTRGCDQVVPEIGITATPVIDLKAGAHGAIYIVAMSKNGSSYYQRLHALDLATGAELFGGPTTVQASYPGTGDNSSNGRVVFDAKQYKDRPALLLLNGVVYTSFGSHCDYRPYTGWSIGYNETTLQQTSVFNFTPNGNEAAPWNAGSGPAADAQGFIYYSLGNGTFESTLNAQGFPSAGDFGNALVKLSTANGTLSAADYWNMYNTVSESGGDVDLGSGGLMLLPDQTDANGKVRHLVVAAGKDANFYLADRDNMGKFVPNSNSTLYQELPNTLGSGIYSSPAYFNGSVYYGPVNRPMLAFHLTAARASGPVSNTSNSFGYPGTNPAISAYGTSNPIVWSVENANPAVLHAYNPANLQAEYYNSNQAASGRDQFGTGNKFIVPTIANGKVFVGSTNSVAGFGVLQTVRGPVADGDYLLRNQSSNLLLDDPGLSTGNNVQQIQWTPTGGPNQSWMVSSQGNGYYLILNASSGLYLTDQNGTVGGPLVQQLRSGSDSQLWSLVAQGPGFLIKNKHSGLVIDDARASNQAGNGMILYPQKTSGNLTNQTWLFQ